MSMPTDADACDRFQEGEKRMNGLELFSYSVYEEQTQLEERELSAFLQAVTEAFGTAQAESASEDWLGEAELMDAPPRSTCRDWRAVTIAATARLSTRIDGSRLQNSLFASIDTGAMPGSSVNCSALRGMVAS
jgi:hypothetical protein